MYFEFESQTFSLHYPLGELCLITMWTNVPFPPPHYPNLDMHDLWYSSGWCQDSLEFNETLRSSVGGYTIDYDYHLTPDNLILHLLSQPQPSYPDFVGTFQHLCTSRISKYCLFPALYSSKMQTFQSKMFHSATAFRSLSRD